MFIIYYEYFEGLLRFIEKVCCEYCKGLGVVNICVYFL